jgi:ribosomal protein L10
MCAGDQEDSIIDVAKALVDFAKEHKALTLKEAVLEGDPDLFTVDRPVQDEVAG